MNLEGNAIGLEQLKPILDVLTEVKLVYLNLGHNEEFGPEGGKALEECLKAAPPTLRTLELGSAFLEDEGVAAVLEGLRLEGRHQVQHLDLSCNTLERMDMFLPPLAGLTTLNVQEN